MERRLAEISRLSRSRRTVPRPCSWRRASPTHSDYFFSMAPLCHDFSLHGHAALYYCPALHLHASAAHYFAVAVARAVDPFFGRMTPLFIHALCLTLYLVFVREEEKRMRRIGRLLCLFLCCMFCIAPFATANVKRNRRLDRNWKAPQQHRRKAAAGILDRKYP